MLNSYPLNRYQVMLETLKKPEYSRLPVAISGGGSIGRKVAFFLEQVGIKVDCFLVDRPYFKEQNQVIDGIPVVIKEDYLAKTECVLLIAYRGYKPEHIPEELRCNIKLLFDYDFIGYLVLQDSFKEPLDEEYLMTRKADVEWVYRHLADEKSEKALDDFIYQRIYGNYAKTFDENQYFDETIIKLTNNEVFVDCGAFQGETLLQFAAFAKSQGIHTWDKLIAFEPEPANIEIMRENIQGIPNVQFEQAGVWSSSKMLYINSGDGSNSTITETGDCAIQVEAIDDVLKGEKATFIKMDIEGSEMEALIGAQNTIRQYKPKLAICIYHKRGDFIDIPQYIKSLREDYQFYIRNYDSSGIECVLYAV